MKFRSDLFNKGAGFLVICLIIILGLTNNYIANEDLQDNARSIEDIYQTLKLSNEPVIYDELLISNSHEVRSLKNVRAELVEGNLRFIFNSDSEVMFKGNYRVLSLDRDMVLDMDGNLVKGRFKVEDSYSDNPLELDVRGMKMKLYADSEINILSDSIIVENKGNKKVSVEYKGYRIQVLQKGAFYSFETLEKVAIVYPPNKELLIPEKLENPEDLNFIFYTSEKGGFKLKNGIFQQTGRNEDGNLIETETILNYNLKEGLFFDSVNAIIKDEKGDLDIKIYNPISQADSEEDIVPKSYLFIVEDKSTINLGLDESKNYLYWDKKELILNSPTANGVSVSFDQDNNRGFLLTSESSVALQANIGKISVTTKDIPELSISGRSLVSLDSKTITAQGFGLYFDPNHGNIEGFDSKEYSVPLKIIQVDKNGERMSDLDIYSNDKNQYFFKDYDKGEEDSRITFNRLSPDMKMFYDGMKESEKKNYYSIIDFDGKILLQQKLASRLTPSKDPTKASVKVLRDLGSRVFGDYVGSGTVVGYEGSSPIVLSAGHVTSTKPGEKLKIETLDGKKFSATLIAAMNSPTTARDLAIIRIDEFVDLPYISIASEGSSIKKGDQMLRIGYPNGEFKQTQVEVVNIDGLSEEEPGDNRGVSGGSLVKDGRLYGVPVLNPMQIGEKRKSLMSMPLEEIINFLRKNGYGHLIPEN